MHFAFRPAVLAGLVGGTVMVVFRLLLRVAGVNLKMDVARMWGTMLTVPGIPGRIVGLLIHFILSAAIAVVYAWVFSLVGAVKQAWRWGVAGAILHWFLAGLFLMIVPPLHPEIPEKRPAPGPFAAKYGRADVLGFLFGHLAYGLTVGIMYPIFLRRERERRKMA